MLTAIGLFVLGLVLLALGGDSIVKGAAGLAQRFGLSAFATGLVLVAFATSLPELAVNLTAILHGQDELALGNAVGSNVANIGLTLGAAAFAAPIVVRWRALSALLLVLVLGTVAVLGLGADGTLSRIEGCVLLLVFVAVFFFALARGRRESDEVRAQIALYAQTSTMLAQNLIRFVLGAALVWAGSLLVVGGEGVHLFGMDLSTAGAAAIGKGMGLSPVLTGLLPVAIGTALPEVAAAIAAARRGQGDMVMGHVIGASVFNILVIVGGMAAYHALALPMTLMGPGRFALPLGYELLGALAFALMLYPVLRGDLRVSKGEGGFLLVAYGLWIAFEWLLAGK
ncbi:sodium:calcium antiporter [Lysobacter yangpyeongensis]|uniref:Sodium:calcium antiporter n=1 Tax=Lysobacter yangpyeongensis TaxID=346182 RepID=A0ABW0SQM2_9GAMM